MACNSVSEGSVSSINPISSISSTLADVFWTRNRLQGVGVKLPPSCLFVDRELLFIYLKLGTHISNF